MLARWARCLATEWSETAAVVFEANNIRGRALQGLVVRQPGEDDSSVGEHLPSATLCGVAGAMTESHIKKFAQAVGSLIFKVSRD